VLESKPFTKIIISMVLEYSSIDRQVRRQSQDGVISETSEQSSQISPPETCWKSFLKKFRKAS
jgi:hypothetical protein